jgi:hypothetical protein
MFAEERYENSSVVRGIWEKTLAVIESGQIKAVS